MKAEEMFRERGYSKEENENFIKYFNACGENTDKKVCFKLRKKTVCAEEYWFSDEIDMPTFKAIHKQLEELGWLDE